MDERKNKIEIQKRRLQNRQKEINIKNRKKFKQDVEKQKDKQI